MPTVTYNLQGNSEDLEKALRDAGIGFDKLGASANKASKEVDDGGKKTSAAAKGMGMAWSTAGGLATGALAGVAAGLFALKELANFAVGIVQGFDSLITSASAAADEMEKLAEYSGSVISDADIAKVQDLGDKWAGVKSIWGAISTQLAADLAPQLEVVIKVVGALGLFLIDNASNWKYWGAVVLATIADYIITPVKIAHSAINMLVQGMAQIGYVSKEAAAEVQEMNDSLNLVKLVTEEFAEVRPLQDYLKDIDATVAAHKRLSAATTPVKEEFKEVKIALDDMWASEKEVMELGIGLGAALESVATQTETVTINTENAGKAFEETTTKGTTFWESFKGAAEGTLTAIGEGISGINDIFQALWEMQDERSDEEIAKLKKEKKAKKKHLDALLDDWNEHGKEMTGSERIAAQAAIAIERDKLEQQQALIDAANAKKKQAMMTAFRANQLASVGTIAISTSLAIMAALAPPPVGYGPVAGIPAGVGLGVLGGIQAAIVMAQKPPSMHTGGVVDEVQRTLLQGEGVLNRSAMSDPDVRDAMEAANRGMGGRGRESGSQDIYLNDRFFQRINKRTARVSSSKKRQGIANHYSGRRAA